MHDGTTHFEGCWETGRDHYECALLKIEELQQRYEGLDFLWLCAFRYCLGRMSYVVGEFCDLLPNYWNLISHSVRNTILYELEQAIKEDEKDRSINNDVIIKKLPLGMEYDRISWLKLFTKLKNLEARSYNEAT